MGEEQHKKKSRKKIFLLILAVIAAVIGAGVYRLYRFYHQANEALDQIQRYEIPKEEVKINQEVETNEALQGYTNLALFGLDTREGDLNQANSDTIIIASINHDKKEVKLVSVYRDTYLDIGEGLYRKANAAYANGGPSRAVKMLNENLDLDIEDYISVDFGALADVIDALGGLTITVDEAECVHLNNYCVETSEATGGDYEELPGAGTYLMNGVQAVSYARIRYTAGNDFKRTERQREVIAKLIEKAKKADLKTLYRIVNAVFPEVLTSFEKKELVELGTSLITYSLGETAGFPFSHKTGGKGGSGDDEIPVTLESNVEELHAYLFEEEGYQASAKVKEISAQIVEDTGYDEDTDASRENFTTQTGEDFEETEALSEKEMESGTKTELEAESETEISSEP